MQGDQLRRQHSTSALVVAYLVAVAALAVACFALALFFGNRASETSQIQQLGRALDSTRAQNAQLARSNSKLAGQVSGLDNLISPLIPLGVYTDRCSQYFTGPNGNPATYELPCAAKTSG
jgi:cytochrome c-type biogenesis protein CcmH/NrfF